MTKWIRIGRRKTKLNGKDTMPLNKSKKKWLNHSFGKSQGSTNRLNWAKYHCTKKSWTTGGNVATTLASKKLKRKLRKTHHQYLIGCNNKEKIMLAVLRTAVRAVMSLTSRARTSLKTFRLIEMSSTWLRIKIQTPKSDTKIYKG